MGAKGGGWLVLKKILHETSHYYNILSTIMKDGNYEMNEYM
jgi:hypothetical protein